MSEYYLKKVYPGSPKPGTIVKLDKIDHVYYYFEKDSYTGIGSSIIENNPEFWEKIVEKDYDVLSITNNYKDIYVLESDGMYHHHNYPGKLDQNLTVSKDKLKIHGSGFNIYSVKRLSDSQVFTIGDRTKLGIILAIDNPGSKNSTMFRYKIDNTGKGWRDMRDAVKLTPLFKTEDGICCYCKEKTPKKFRTLEHKQPLSRGGKHSSDNIVMSCLSCNCSKRNMTEEEFKNFKIKRHV